MEKFYFTYGSDPNFPFYYGWTEIEAPDMRKACAIFSVIHPNRPESATLNCAFVYNEERFERVRNTISSAGPLCHERISWEVLNNGR